MSRPQTTHPLIAGIDLQNTNSQHAVNFSWLLASIPGSGDDIKQLNWFGLVWETKIKISGVIYFNPETGRNMVYQKKS